MPIAKLEQKNMKKNEEFNELMNGFMNRYSYQDLKELLGSVIAMTFEEAGCVAGAYVIADNLNPFGELLDIIRTYDKEF